MAGVERLLLTVFVTALAGSCAATSGQPAPSEDASAAVDGTNPRVSDAVGAFDATGVDIALPHAKPDSVHADTHDPLDCVDGPLSVYATPPNLPPHSLAERGRVVRCAVDGKLPAAFLSQVATSAGYKNLPLKSPIAAWRIGYRTERAPGKGGIGTARVFVPTVGARTDGFVVAAHGTVGVADSCAPSLAVERSAYLVLPALAAGWPVIAPDYAGLGTDGVQGYFDTRDTAASVLDAVRAFGQLKPSYSDKPFVVYGHSQGGGAALSAQALSESYGPKARLKGVIALAPGHTRTDRSEWVHIPNYEVGGSAGYYALLLYADFANLLGEEQAGYAFTPAIRDELVNLIGHLCHWQYNAAVAKLVTKLGDIYDDAFEAAVKACLVEPPGKACTDIAKQWIARNRASVVPADPNGAPILMMAGGKDTETPLQNMACLREWFTKSGQPPEACLDANATHYTTVLNGMAHALSWIDARITGKTPPTCAPANYGKCPWKV